MEGEETLIAFDKSGKTVGVVPLPKSFYLITEKDWVLNALEKSPQLDGMAIIVNWDERKIKSVRYAE